MATQSTLAAPARKQRRSVQTPVEAGLPDPRPVTDYTVTLSTVGGHSRITVVLSQPCVIKNPLWPLIDCMAGTLVFPSSSTVVNNTTFFLDFPGIITTSTAFVSVPYQDTQVQNFQGGFVRSGGQWFRQPVIN
jgi:hypothetical protein